MIKKISIKPLRDGVLIQALSDDERAKKTKSGIVIPETVDNGKIDRGRVVEVGPGKVDENGKTIPVAVKKGQLVVFPEFSSEKIKVGDEEYYLVSEGNILAVIE